MWAVPISNEQLAPFRPFEPTAQERLERAVQALAEQGHRAEGLLRSIATHGPYRRFSHGWGRDPKGRIEAHKDMVYSCTNAIALDTRRLSCS